MIKVYYPENSVDLAMIRSILDEERIPYTVINENFGDLKAGPQIRYFNERIISVPDDYAERAREIITDYRDTIKDDADRKVNGHTWRDKLRMLFEIIMFMWVMPGKRHKKDEEPT